MRSEGCECRGLDSKGLSSSQQHAVYSAGPKKQWQLYQLLLQCSWQPQKRNS